MKRVLTILGAAAIILGGFVTLKWVNNTISSLEALEQSAESHLDRIRSHADSALLQAQRKLQASAQQSTPDVQGIEEAALHLGYARWFMFEINGLKPFVMLETEHALMIAHDELQNALRDGTISEYELDRVRHMTQLFDKVLSCLDPRDADYDQVPWDMACVTDMENLAEKATRNNFNSFQ